MATLVPAILCGIGNRVVAENIPPKTAGNHLSVEKDVLIYLYTVTVVTLAVRLHSTVNKFITVME